MIEATMKEKVKEFIVKNFKWIILFICLIGFLAIAENKGKKVYLISDKDIAWEAEVEGNI